MRKIPRELLLILIPPLLFLFSHLPIPILALFLFAICIFLPFPLIFLGIYFLVKGQKNWVKFITGLILILEAFILGYLTSIRVYLTLA